MLSDAPFTSTWSSGPDVLITGDYKLPVVGECDADDDILDMYKSPCDVDNVSYLESLSGSSCMTTGSECSNDDLYADGSDDGFVFDIDTDTGIQGLDSNLNVIIEPSTLASCHLSDDEMMSNSSCESANIWSPYTVPEASQAFTCSTMQPSSKCQSRRIQNTPCIKWSRMSKSEKAKTVDELSLMISNELDVREQMEIIRLIHPTATFNRQTTQFVIDLNAIDDVKLEQIKDIVNFHCVQLCDLTDNHRSHGSHNKKKKNKSEDRKPKVEKQRIQKENRQKLKEKRSGLFVKEERLAVCDSIMEEDIDILG